MEIEQSPEFIGKKLWKIVRIVFYMLRNGISNSKLLSPDFHMMFQRGKLAGRSMISNLMLLHHHHHQYHYYTPALACGSTDVQMSFVSPREYEFSCSKSPVYPSYFYHRHKYYNRNHHHLRRHSHQENNRRNKTTHDDVNGVQKASDTLSKNHCETVEASPLVVLPGSGWSPQVRQLRVTDSPFSLKGTEEDPTVDKEAEEFIKKFYKELKQQKTMAAIEYPSPYHRSTRPI